MAPHGLKTAIVAPTCKKEFTKAWAKDVLLAYKTREDPGWLLADLVQVLDVTVTENSDPGMLSHSYFVQVSYKEGSSNPLRVESWFVKVPKSATTSPMDSVEAHMLNELIPNMVETAKTTTNNRSGLELPVPKTIYCHHDENFSKNLNFVVTEDLRNRRFKPLTSKVCGVVYMRAQMKALAHLHAAAFLYQEKLGGKRALLRKNPKIKERLLPRINDIKRCLEERLLAYLTYLSRIKPDLDNQLKIFIKFERHLPKVFKTIHKTPGLHDMKAMVHGDSKLDNFLFKKVAHAEEEEYDAILIDWQGACYDFLSSDVMWALYGFMKNLPDKNSTIDTFLDYSLAFYHQELLKFLKLYKLTPQELYLPDHEYDGVNLIKKGFVYDFLRVVLIRPVLSLQDPDNLMNWFNNQDTQELPEVTKVFRTGQSYVNFIFLYFTIATEIGVFHELAPLCFAALKEAMFATPGEPEEESDDDMADENYGLGKNAMLNINCGLAQCNAEVQEELEKESDVNEVKKIEDHETKEKQDHDEINSSKVRDDSSKLNGDQAEDESALQKDHESDVQETSSSRNARVLSRRPSYMRQGSSISMPEVLEDSDAEDYEYSKDNKSTVSHTFKVRKPSTDGLWK